MRPELRRLSAAAARRLAWLSFCVAILASPARAGILVAAHPIAPLYSGYTDLRLSWSTLAAVATLLCWGISLAAEPRPVDLGPRFLRWPAAALVLMAWASAIASIDPAISAWSAFEATVLAALALYALNEVRSLSLLVVPVGTMLALQAVVGIAQVASQGSVGLAGLGELALDPRIHGVSVVTSAEGVRLLRAYGLTDHPNILAGLLALGLPLLALGLTGAGRRSLLVLAAIGLATVALLLTFSRAGYLAAGAEAAVALALLAWAGHWGAARRWAAAAAASALLCLAVALPYAPFMLERTDLGGVRTDTEAMSTGERLILAGDTASIALGHPLVGTGIGTVPLALLRARPSLTFDYQPAPVVVLDVAAELGLPAAIASIVLMLGPWVALWRRRGRWTVELAALSAALAGLTIVGFLDYYPWTYSAGRMWAWLLPGLWAAAYLRATAPRPIPLAAAASPARLLRGPADAHA